jgi:hypothetical protein
MAADFTLADCDRLLQACERDPALLGDLPGIDPFHGISGYSAVPRARRIVAALRKVEQTQPAPQGRARLEAAAEDAGVAVWEVEQFLTEFEEMRKGIQKVAELGWWQQIKLLLGWTSLQNSNEKKS